MKKTFYHKDLQYNVDLQKDRQFTVFGKINETAVSGQAVPLLPQLLRVDLGSGPANVHLVHLADRILLQINGKQVALEKPGARGAQRPGASTSGEDAKSVETPMPGKILDIFVSAGQSIKKGERLFIVEAMKMENEVLSPRDAVVKEVNFKENDLVALGEPVVEFEV